jgi:hypothetical protein
MAYFAELDQNNKVTQVFEVSDEDIKDSDGNIVEELGINICKNIFGADTRWKQTSPDNSFRVRFARVDYTYDETLDAFIPPKPFESWVLNPDTLDWESPIGPAPQLNEDQMKYYFFYAWDEEEHKKDPTKGWVLRKSMPQPTTGL